MNAGEGDGVNISRYGNPDADIVLIQPVDDHDLAGIENEVAEIQRLTDQDFCLIAIRVGDWNTDLSPWKAPAVFGKEDFGGGADRTLKEVLKYTEDPAKTYYIGGYSLAALFAMKAIKDAGIPLRKSIRMILGCDEESGWEDMEYYGAHEQIPDIGFSPDASFPLINTEKGMLCLELRAPEAKAGLKILELSTGDRINVIPGE